MGFNEADADNSPDRVRVKSTGRVGTVLVHHPKDSLLTFKIKFDDGSPDDWFAGNNVELEKCLAPGEVCTKWPSGCCAGRSSCRRRAPSGDSPVKCSGGEL